MVSRALCESRAHFLLFCRWGEKSKKEKSCTKQKNLGNFFEEKAFFYADFAVFR